MIEWLLERPFFFYAAAFALVWAIVRNCKGVPASRWIQVAAWTGWVVLAIMFAASVLSCLQPTMHGYMGSTVLAIAAGYPRGLPMYHAIDAPAMYSVLYGPYAYLVYTPVIELFPHLVAVRIYVAVANLVCFVAVYAAVRRYTSRVIALVLLSMMTSALIATQWTFFSMNADIWLFLFTALGLFFADARDRWWQAPGLGVCAGLLLDTKLSVLALVGLLLIIQLRRQGWRSVVLSIGVTAFVVALPFFSPIISLRNYLAWFTWTGHRAVSGDLIINSILCLLFVYAPSLLMLLLARSRAASVPGQQGVSFFATRFDRLLSWAYALALLATTLLLSLAASQVGAGYWHFWPLLPFICLWTAQLATTPTIAPALLRDPPLLTADMVSQRAAMTLAALCLAGLLITLRYSPRSFAALAANTNVAGFRQEHQAEAELKAFGQQFQTRAITVAPGLDMDTSATKLRFELVHQNGTYIVDSLAMDALEAFGTLPPSLTPRLLSCDTLWMTPHGDTPFSTLNRSKSRTYLFPDQVRLGFPVSHHVLATGKFYDVWGCAQP